MHVLILRPYRKDNIYFRTIEEREKIMVDIRIKIHEDSLRAFQVVERTRLRRNLVMVEVPLEITQKV